MISHRDFIKHNVVKGTQLKAFPPKVCHCTPGANVIIKVRTFFLEFSLFYGDHGFLREEDVHRRPRRDYYHQSGLGAVGRYEKCIWCTPYSSRKNIRSDSHQK